MFLLTLVFVVIAPLYPCAILIYRQRAALHTFKRAVRHTIHNNNNNNYKHAGHVWGERSERALCMNFVLRTAHAEEKKKGVTRTYDNNNI